MDLLRGMMAILLKDLQTELRSRYAMNTVLAFVGASLLLILFALDAARLNPIPQSALIWIIILFAALSSLSRAFVVETDKKTYLLLRLHGRASEIFLGKFCFNYLFTLAVTFITFLGYIFLLGLTVTDFKAFLRSEEHTSELQSRFDLV